MSLLNNILNIFIEKKINSKQNNIQSINEILDSYKKRKMDIIDSTINNIEIDKDPDPMDHDYDPMQIEYDYCVVATGTSNGIWKPADPMVCQADRHKWWAKEYRIRCFVMG